MKSEKIGLVVAAAGASARMGSIDKIWTLVGDHPMYYWSLRSLAPRCDRVAIVVREDQVQRMRDALSADFANVEVVAGSVERRQSVACGLSAMADVDVVAVHDCARPFATATLLERALAHLEAHDGVIPVIRVVDTIKRVGANETVVETLKRRELRAAQTPQVFRASALRLAHSTAALMSLDATDDAALLEAMGKSVMAVDGEQNNFKITTPFDLKIAQIIAEECAI